METPEITAEEIIRPFAFHALLVEVFPTGELRVRVDNGFMGQGGQPPTTATLRPAQTGLEPVPLGTGLAQAEQLAGELLRMLRSVYGPLEAAKEAK